MKYVPDVDGVDVLVPHGRQRVDVDFVRLRRTHRVPAPLYWIGLDVPNEDVPALVPDHMSDGDELADGARRWKIPMAPIARAAIDAVRFRYQALLNGAGKLERPVRRKLLQDARALLCETVQRRRIRDSDLVAELDRGPHAYSAVVRLALLDIIAGCRSAPECELRDLIRRSRVLPEPRWN